MATWSNPVYDRSLANVQAAVAALIAWVGESPHSAMTDLKGCLNVSDLNRIESDTQWLRDELETCGYSIDITTKTDWAVTDFPTRNDVTRIITNVQSIVDGYVEYREAPSLPTDMTSYTQVNDIEENLYWLKQVLGWMVEQYRYCSTEYNGASTMVCGIWPPS